MLARVDVRTMVTPLLMVMFAIGATDLLFTLMGPRELALSPAA